MHRTPESLAICSTAIRKTNHWLAYFCLAVLLLGVAVPQSHAAVTRRYAYVIDNAGAIDEMSINPGNGALAALVGCPAIPPLIAPVAAEVNPSGRFLYVADSGGGGAIWVYTITAPVLHQGCLNFVGVFPTLLPPASIGVDNLYVYVSEPIGNQIEGFPIANFVTGALGPAVLGSPFFAGPNPMGLAIDSAAPYLYVANDVAAGTITAFTRLAGGGLGIIGPFATGAFPTQVAVDPVEQFVFVIYPNFVESYPIIPGVGALGAPNVPVATGAAPMGLAVSRFGQLAYVANNGPNTVSGYLVNNATGQAAANGGAGTAVAPMGATVEQQGKYLYIADFGSAQVSGYTINANTGALAPILGSPWGAGVRPIAIATQP